VIRSPHRLLKHGVKQMAHRGFSEGVRGSFILVALVDLEAAAVPARCRATPKCFLLATARICFNACRGTVSRRAHNRATAPMVSGVSPPLREIPVSHWRRPLASTTASARNPGVCFRPEVSRSMSANIDCPTGQMCTSITHLCADPTIDKNYNPVTNRVRRHE